MAALNPGQFKGPLYHGTTFDLQGKDIVPADRLDHTKSNWGSVGHSGQYSDRHAFATESEDTAWQFGSQAGMMKRSQAEAAKSRNAQADAQIEDPKIREMVKDPVPDVGRVRVHEVAPHPLMKQGVYHADHPAHDGGEDLQEWVAPSFRSKGTLDTMPGRQGTFPSLNWNQFKSKNAGYGADANHPSDAEIHEGHTPVGSGEAILNHMRKNGHLDEAPGGVTDEHQLDLFSGDTVGEHAEMDNSRVGDYHRNNLFGRI